MRGLIEQIKGMYRALLEDDELFTLGAQAMKKSIFSPGLARASTRSSRMALLSSQPLGPLWRPCSLI